MPARILLIEDNPANLELMSYLLGAFGYAPVAAVDGAEGLAAARREVPDLIICDIQLPTMSGFEVARQLKHDASLRAIPLVAVTAFAMVGDRERVLAAGFDGYIAKPINPETFVREMEVFLRAERPAAFMPWSGEGGAAPARPAARHTVLVVDNLVVNLELARSILEPHGFRVVTARGISEGLVVARQHPCDLILSDVCMDDGNGYDFIRAVKADPALRDVPFVFMTATMLEPKDRAKGLAFGAARFLMRPIEPEALLAEIATVLREKGSA
jgi:two-component system cell cycle response regulator